MSVTIAVVVAIFALILWVGVIVRFVGAIFFASVQKRVIAHPFLHGLWFFAALLLTLGALRPIRSAPPVRDRDRALRVMSQLESPCRSYRVEYDSLPAGDNAVVIKTLRGSNPRSVIFMYLESRDVNPSGEAIDPWGTPYRFKLQDGQPPSIQSAGPNRVFGDKDDLVVPEPEDRTVKTP